MFCCLDNFTAIIDGSVARIDEPTPIPPPTVLDHRTNRVGQFRQRLVYQQAQSGFIRQACLHSRELNVTFATALIKLFLPSPPIGCKVPGSKLRLSPQAGQSERTMNTMPTTKSYRQLHDRVTARPGAAERLAELRTETLAEMRLYGLHQLSGPVPDRRRKNSCGQPPD